MELIRNETLVENVIRPTTDAVRSGFLKAFLILTVFCLLYAGFLGAKYYFLRSDTEAAESHILVMKKGAVTIGVMYGVLVTLRIMLAVAIRVLGL